MSAPIGDSAIGKVHFLTSYVWRVWDRSLHFLSCLCVQPYLLNIYGSSGSVGSLIRGSSSPVIFTVQPATFSGWVGTRYVVLTRAFKRITHIGVNGALSSSQRLLWQARAPYRCITPEWLLISKLLNPRPANLEPGRSGPNYCLPSPRRAFNKESGKETFT